MSAIDLNGGVTGVLYCTDTLMAGGTERQLVQLITRLDRARFDPQVICLQGQHGGLSLHFAPQLQAVNVPLHIFNLGWTPIDIARSMLRTAKVAWLVRPHIIHAVNHHSNHITRLIRPILPHSLRLITSVPTEFNMRQLLYERLEQWACDAIVCISPYLKQRVIEQSRVSAEKVFYIPIGLDIAKFSSNTTPDFRSQIVPSGSRVILVIGRITKQKSPHLLAQAIGLLKERGQLPTQVYVVIVGERENAILQAQLDDTVRAYSLEGVVRQFPQTSQPEVFYHAADFVVLASLWEGVPNVALESLASGRPVIISEAANVSGLIEQDKTGWIVRTGNIEHLAETLRVVLSLPTEMLASMRPDCLERVKDYALPLMIERYTALYDRLCAMPRP